MARSCQIENEVRSWYIMSKTHVASLTNLFILMLTILGCSTTKLQIPWGLQSDTPDVYKYYEGPELPIEKLAILRIESPVAIKFDGSYYNGTFAVIPEEQTIDLWYTQNEEGRLTSSLRSVTPTVFTAVAGRRYKAITKDFFDDTSVPPHYWNPEIVDITDEAAPSTLIREPTSLGVNKVQELLARTADRSTIVDESTQTESPHILARELQSWHPISTSEIARLEATIETNSDRHLENQLEKDGDESNKIRKFVLTLQGGDPDQYKPIFCLHPAIGAISYLINVVQHLNPKQPVYGIQSPAFGGVRDPFDKMEEMAAYYIHAMRVIQPDGPYMLLGHSSGAYIAYEMALKLQKERIETPLLVIVDEEAPLPKEEIKATIMDIFKRDDLFESPEVMYFTAWAVSLAHGKKLTFSLEDLIPLSNEERYKKTTEFLKHADFVSQDAPNDIVKVIMQMYANHSKADESYLKKFADSKMIERFTGKVVLFRCTEKTTYEGTGITDFPNTSEFSNWDKFCSGPIDVIGVPNSNHITMIMEPCVRFLGERLQAYLDDFGKVNN